MLFMGISELLFVNSVYPWLVAFLIFPNTMHYFNLKPFTSTTLQAFLKLHTLIYSIQCIITSCGWLGGFFCKISLKCLWNSSITMRGFSPSSNLSHYISSFFKAVVGAPAHVVWFWLYYSLNNLSPAAPVPGCSY